MRPPDWLLVAPAEGSADLQARVAKFELRNLAFPVPFGRVGKAKRGKALLWLARR